MMKQLSREDLRQLLIYIKNITQKRASVLNILGLFGEDYVRDVIEKSYKGITNENINTLEVARKYATGVARKKYATALENNKKKNIFVLFDPMEMKNLAKAPVNDFDRYDTSELASLVYQEALSMLSAEDREFCLAIHKNDKNDGSLKDLAKKLGLSYENLKTKRHRINQKLIEFGKEILKNL